MYTQDFSIGKAQVTKSDAIFSFAFNSLKLWKPYNPLCDLKL